MSNTCGTCKTCRFWAASAPEEWPLIDDRKTVAASFCTNPLLGGEQAARAPMQASGLRYYFDEDAPIVTGPDFGCVHHDLRPTVA